MEKVKNVETTSKKLVGENQDFESIRRITGYLVGTTKRFNNAKQAELEDRIEHEDK